MKSFKKTLAVFLAAVSIVSASVPAVQASAAESAYEPFYVADSNGVICTANMESINKGNMIWFPQEMIEEGNQETYPVVVWANGTMCVPALYYELLSEIASGGYIVVTNTELFAGNGVEQSNSIDFIIGENTDEDSIFYQHVDTENIGVAGHSQGGMSSVNCAVSDSRVDCVFSIAGNTDKNNAKNLTVPVCYLTGTKDYVVMSSLYVKPAYNNTNSTAVYASLKGANHTHCCGTPSDYSGYAVEWFDAFLKGDESAYQTFAPNGKLSQDSKWQDYKSKNF